MIQLPPGFNLDMFVSDIMTFGTALAGVAVVFCIFNIIRRIFDASK